MATILCVDDDPAMVSLKQQILERAGHTVTPCGSAAEAVRELETRHFDGVVTDWRLGSALGRDVVQSAKADPSVPVIVVSGYLLEAFQAAKPLADLYLEKPVNPRELVKVLDTLLQGKSRGSMSSLNAYPFGLTIPA